jgi:hypothetical protein
MGLGNAHFDHGGIGHFENGWIGHFHNERITHSVNGEIDHFDNGGIAHSCNDGISHFNNCWITHFDNDCLIFWEMVSDGIFSVTTYEYKVHLFSFSEWFEKLVNLTLIKFVTNILYYIFNNIIWLMTTVSHWPLSKAS